MPIDIDTFEREPGFEGDEPSHAERVVAFLARNDDKAWTRGEIAEGTGLDPNAVSSVLARLKQRDVVRHKSPYWALGDESRVRAAANFGDSLDALNEHLGAEDMTAWRAEAPDEHPSERRRDEET